jgi:hypothetical membrane protein
VTRLLLLCGAVAPAIYVAFALGGPLLFPGYDLSTQMVSELGGPDAPNPAIFNIGLMVAGVLTVLSGAGLFLGLRGRGSDAVSVGLAALAVAVFGAAMFVGGLYPMPDERHMAWGMGFAVQAAPLLTLWALRGAHGLAGLKVFLAAVFVAVNGLLAVMFGVGELVDGSNLGLWQRAYGLAMYPWIAVTALALMAGPRERARAAFAR